MNDIWRTRGGVGLVLALGGWAGDRARLGAFQQAGRHL